MMLVLRSIMLQHHVRWHTNTLNSHKVNQESFSIKSPPNLAPCLTARYVSSDARVLAITSLRQNSVRADAVDIGQYLDSN